MTETKVFSEKLFDGRVLKLYRDEVDIGGGRFSVREVVCHSGGAAVLAVKDGKVLLEKQYRYAVGEALIELPAGKRDAGENLVTTAVREFEEETGLRPLKVEKICEFFPSPAYTDERIGVFFASEFEEGKIHFDEDENLESFWVDLATAYEWLDGGKIVDAKTIIALQWYAARNDKK